MARSRIALEGLPHSEIPGSKLVCSSPRLIAAYRVLHRRPAPRHPPHALSSLTTTFALLKTPWSVVLCRCPSSSVTSVFNEPGLFRPVSVAWWLDATARRPAFSSSGRALASLPGRSLSGGADRDRTGDLRLARAALSQLSYSPEVTGAPTRRTGVVGLSGFEPLTSRLSGVRS